MMPYTIPVSFFPLSKQLGMVAWESQAMKRSWLSLHDRQLPLMSVVSAHLNGNLCSTEVERMLSQNILEPQKINVRTQCHLAHAVCVEVKLILYYFCKMLQKQTSVYCIWCSVLFVDLPQQPKNISSVGFQVQICSSYVNAVSNAYHHTFLS